MKWEQVKIGDCCEVTSSKRIFYSEYVSNGVPFYRSKEIIQIFNGGKHDDPLYISTDKYNEIKGKFGVPQAGDMLLTAVGTIGIPYIVSASDYFYFKDGNLTWFKDFHEKLNSVYLYYWIISDGGKGVLYNSTIGSSQKALTISAIKNIQIPLPPLPTQCRIAEILSAYDDLIENNQKQIKLLEEAAMLLYKEWFVKLRFPRRENVKIVDGLPDKWDSGTLEDSIEFDPRVKLVKGKLKKSVAMAALDTSSMILDHGQFTDTYSNAGSKFQNGDTLLARITPCLENGKTAFVSNLQDVDGAIGSTEYIVMRSKRLNPYMVYCVARSNSFRQIAINSMTGADGRQRVQADKLKSIPCLIPPSYLVDLCGNVLQPVFQKIS